MSKKAKKKNKDNGITNIDSYLKEEDGKFTISNSL
jgi:hypothetical protein